MKIYFVETEQAEQEFFASKLSDHELHFVEQLDEVESDVEILSTFIYSHIDRAFLDSHPALKFIATRSTGFDHIDIAECGKRGIVVSSVGSYGENTVAEHTFALILALSRRLRESLAANRNEKFSFEAIRGFDLKHKTLGVLGSGRIGLHAIRMARAFDMRVIAYDTHPQWFMAEILGFEYVALDYLLQCSDIITVHLPLMPSTQHILNREAFAKCKRGALVINTARGGLIDTDALIEALDSGVIAGAGIDVLEEERVLQQEPVNIIGAQIVSRLQSGVSSDELRVRKPERIQELQQLIRNNELISRPNVVFTPHVAFNSVEAVERINLTTLESINGFLSGAPRNQVPVRVE